jgi:hypothetical protein
MAINKIWYEHYALGDCAYALLLVHVADTEQI